MNHTPKISIIIPIYNVEKYIENAINSLINQTYTNLEIILVDDGATDESGKICDDYAKKDNRIKVIHKENGGVSTARNAGLDAVTGDYVGFLDPDDVVHPQMYEILYSIFEKEDCEIAVCNFENIHNHSVDFPNIDINDYAVISRNDFLKLEYVSSQTALLIGSLCNKLYKTSLISDINFNTAYTCNEDLVFALDYLPKIDKVPFLNKPLYYYFKREDSLTHAPSVDRVITHMNSRRYKLKFCKDYTPDLYDEEIRLFKKRYFISFNKIRNFEMDKIIRIKKYFSSHRFKDVSTMSKLITAGQKTFIIMLPILSVSFTVKLADYNFDIWQYIKTVSRVKILKK